MLIGKSFKENANAIALNHQVRNPNVDVHESGPLITVYMPTHNRLALLRRAVRSLQAQTYKDFEVVIVDDGSSDGTEGYLQWLAQQDARFRYFRLAIPKGACAARNYAIHQATGKYVTGLDDDDEFLPKRLELLANSPVEKYAFVFTTQYWNYGKHKRILNCRKAVVGPEDLLSINYPRNQVIVEREKLLSVGGFDESMPSCQDWDAWIRLCLRYGNAYRSAEPTYVTHTAHEYGRISGSQNRVKGYQRIIDKFEHVSSASNRRDQLFLLFMAAGRRLEVRQLVRCATWRNASMALRYYLSSNLPSVASFRRKMLRGS